VSSIASDAAYPMKSAATRTGRVNPAIWIGSVMASAIGTAGSTRCTSRARSGRSRAGSADVRIAIRESISPGFCQNGTYAHSWAVSVRLVSTESATTPTICRGVPR
jgi:hypothetical protein